MITIRRSEERGHTDHGWLESRHTFSFADHYDPAHMGFGPLRVINEDRVKPGQGFGRHGHRDMEILSYVLDGALEHKDSIGTGSVIRRGDVQRMSAGTGIQHSEFNSSQRDPVHFLQIWILPERKGIAPGYEQKTFPDADKRGRLRLVASPDGGAGSLRINADARVYAGMFDAGQKADLALGDRRYAWVQVAEGRVRVNSQELASGDGVAISDERHLTIEGTDTGEILVFDLA